MSVTSAACIRSQRKTQTGVGLIEVLIAALIFALGILGMASMQIGAKRSSYDALQRSLATTLAHDIIERMRSNPSPAALNVFGAVSNLGGGTIAVAPTACTSLAPCSPTQLATRDIWEWEQALDGASEINSGVNAGGLMSPKACITYAAGVITVTIAWQGYDGLMDPRPANLCGKNLGLYGANDTQRQIVEISTYIEEV